MTSSDIIKFGFGSSADDVNSDTILPHKANTANLLANMEATDDTYKTFINVKGDDVHVLFTGGRKNVSFCR